MPRFTRVDSGRRNAVADLQAILAEKFIGVEEGQRLPSVRELSAHLKMSVGAISTALNSLEEMGAVTIEKRGHMGSYLTRMSVPMLWNLLGQGPLVIALTLPMHSRFEGLATGLKLGFEKSGIETYLTFIRGSRTRLKALHDGRCHAVAMSGLGAEELDQEDEVFLSLPSTSWLSGYAVYYRDSPPEPGRPIRFAVDSQSYDSRRILDLEFAGREVEIRWVSYVQMPRLLRKGEVDAIIWNTDQKESLLGPDISCQPLSERVMSSVGEKAISAVLVGRRGSSAIRAMLRAAIDPVELMGIQAMVVNGTMIPEY